MDVVNGRNSSSGEPARVGRTHRLSRAVRAIAILLVAIASVITVGTSAWADVINGSSVPSTCHFPDFYNHGTPSHGGPLTLVPYLWGYSNATYANQMDVVYRQLETSNLYGWLQTEYGAPVINHIFPQTAQPIRSANENPMKEADIISDLRFYATSNVVVPPPANSIYVVHLPPGVTTDFIKCSPWADNGRDAPGLFGGPTIYFIILLDPSTCPNRPSGISGFNRTTLSLSHEVSENVTDPDGSGWRDNTQTSQPCASGQIGDLCALEQATIQTPVTSSGNVSSSSVVFQKEWSININACVAEDFDPPQTPQPGQQVGAIEQTSGQADVFYVEPDGALILGWEQRNGPWNRYAALSAPGFSTAGTPVTAMAQGPNQIDAIVADKNGVPNVFYEANNGAWSATPYVPPSLNGNGWVGFDSVSKLSPIVTDYQVDDTQLDVFYVGVAGGLMVQSVNGGCPGLC